MDANKEDFLDVRYVVGLIHLAFLQGIKIIIWIKKIENDNINCK